MKEKSPKMIAAGKNAAVTRKRRQAVQKAARWATTMTKCLVTKTNVATAHTGSGRAITCDSSARTGL